MSQDNTIKRGRKPKTVNIANDQEVAVNPVLTTNPTAVVNNWQNDFNSLLEIKKPIDPLDCMVVLSDNDRCDASKIKKNSLLYRPARIIYLSDDSTSSNVRNQDLHKAGIDSDWSLGKSLISKQCWTADQYTKIEKVTMTQIASKLKDEVGDCICKIEFTKAPNVAEMAKLIQEGSAIIESSNTSNKTILYKKLYERSQIGEVRIMRGYIVRSVDMQIEENETGMVNFLDADLMAEGKFAERLINTKNIISLTFKLIKYQLK